MAKKSRKKSKNKSNTIAKTALHIVVLTTIITAICYNIFFNQAFDGEVNIRITSNTTYGELVAQIQPALRSGVHRIAFDFYAKRLNLEKRYRVGSYSFDDENIIQIVRRIALGDQTPVKLVIGEARTLPHLADKLAAQLKADSKDILSAMRSPKLRKELGFTKDSIIAIFIPNTYEVWWNIAPERLIQRLKQEYNRFWNSERTAKLKRCKLTQYEVMTLASIVYEETKATSEMPTIAGVYINRLRGGMRLQADPTVKYAIGDFGIKRILHKHLRYPSPYNTYLNYGLPPAPICIPSVAAIDAVLNYEQHNYLYFCAHPDLNGKHVFARTLKEHNINARKYAEALDRLKINH